MSNSFNSRTNAALLDAGQTLSTHATTAPATFGLTAAQVASVTTGFNALGAAIVAQANAKAVYEASVTTKDVARAALVGALSGAARSAYADADVTDAQLRTIGLAPRRAGGVRPLALLAPADLVASGFADGTVKLAWSRNGNSQGTTFTIEWSADGLDFEMVETTTRASLLLSGYAPGVPAWFRVIAKRAGLASPASASASAYAPGRPAGVQLRVA